ncbi:MAG: WD40 repeat domain-containing protein [Pirellulales bacterium]
MGTREVDSKTAGQQVGRCKLSSSMRLNYHRCWAAAECLLRMAVGAVVWVASCYLPAMAQAPLSNAEPARRAAGTDIYGDSIPDGAKVRVGTIRFRPGQAAWICYTADSKSIVSLSTGGRLDQWDAASGRLLKTIRLGVSPNRFYSSADGAVCGFSFTKYVSADAGYLSGIQICDSSRGIVAQKSLPADVAGGERLNHISSDGRYLVTTKYSEGRVTVYETAKSRPVATLLLPDKQYIDALIMSPDGQSMVIASDDKLQFWDVAGAKLLDTLDGYAQVSCLAWSPEGETIAVGFGMKEYVELLDAKAHRRTAILSDPAVKFVMARGLLFSRDGTRVVAANSAHITGTPRGSSIVIWDRATGKSTKRLVLDEGSYGAVTMSPNGEQVATVSNGEVAVWNLSDSFRVGIECVGHISTVTCVRLSSDGGRLVTGSQDQTVRIWDTSDGKPMGKIPQGGPVQMVAVSPDGQYVGISCLDNTVSVWEMANQQKKYEFAGHGRSGGVRSLAFTPDSALLRSYGEDGMLRTWELATGKLTNERKIAPQEKSRLVRFSGKEILQGILSRDSSRLVGVYGVNAIAFDAATNEERGFVTAARYIDTNTVSRDGAYLLMAQALSESVQIRLRDGSTRYESPSMYGATLVDLGTTTDRWTYPVMGRVSSLGFSPDGKIVVLCQRAESGDAIHIVETATGQSVGRIDLSDRLNWDYSDSQLDISADGRLAAALDNTSVLIWDLKAMGYWK